MKTNLVSPIALVYLATGCTVAVDDTSDVPASASDAVAPAGDGSEAPLVDESTSEGIIFESDAALVEASAADPRRPTSISLVEPQRARACYCAECIYGPSCSYYKSPSCSTSTLISHCGYWIAIGCSDAYHPCTVGEKLKCCAN